MALFAIQLVRVVLAFISMPVVHWQEPFLGATIDIVIAINQMLNVIIINLFIYTLFFLLIILTWLGHRTNDNFGAGSNEVVLR